jgi:hypothetical protein
MNEVNTSDDYLKEIIKINIVGKTHDDINFRLELEKETSLRQLYDIINIKLNKPKHFGLVFGGKLLKYSKVLTLNMTSIRYDSTITYYLNNQTFISVEVYKNLDNPLDSILNFLPTREKYNTCTIITIYGSYLNNCEKHNSQNAQYKYRNENDFPVELIKKITSVDTNKRNIYVYLVDGEYTNTNEKAELQTLVLLGLEKTEISSKICIYSFSEKEICYNSESSNVSNVSKGFSTEDSFDILQNKYNELKNHIIKNNINILFYTIQMIGSDLVRFYKSKDIFNLILTAGSDQNMETICELIETNKEKLNKKDKIDLIQINRI